VSCLAFSPDGLRLAAARDHRLGKRIQIWDATAYSPVNKFDIPNAGGRTEHSKPYISYSPDGSRIAVVADETLSVWDVLTGTRIWSSQTGGRSERPPAFLPDGSHIIHLSTFGVLIRWDAATGKVVRRAEISEPHRELLSIAYSPDCTRIAWGLYDWPVNRTVCVWDEELGELIAPPMRGHTDEVQGIAFSPDGKELATVAAESDGTIRIWD
ncbi:YVTN repeat-like/Quino protein amine dehydrogenase, partial [Exidia glandulosa HHB12029]